MPLTATDQPNESSGAASEAVSLASSWPVVISKTYAEPEFWPLSSSPKALMTAVFPLTATVRPKKSDAAASEAVSLKSYWPVVTSKT